MLSFPFPAALTILFSSSGAGPNSGPSCRKSVSQVREGPWASTRACALQMSGLGSEGGVGEEDLHPAGLAVHCSGALATRRSFWSV